MTLLVNVLQPEGLIEPFRRIGENHPPFGMPLIETVREGESVACRVVLPQQGRALVQEPGAFGAV